MIKLYIFIQHYSTCPETKKTADSLRNRLMAGAEGLEPGLARYSVNKRILLYHLRPKITIFAIPSSNWFFLISGQLESIPWSNPLIRPRKSNTIIAPGFSILLVVCLYTCLSFDYKNHPTLLHYRQKRSALQQRTPFFLFALFCFEIALHCIFNCTYWQFLAVRKIKRILLYCEIAQLRLNDFDRLCIQIKTDIFWATDVSRGRRTLRSIHK